MFLGLLNSVGYLIRNQNVLHKVVQKKRCPLSSDFLAWLILVLICA